MPLVVERDQHRRAAGVLDDPRGDDPDHPGMPTLPGEHEPVGRVEVEARHLLARLRQRSAVDLLPLAIELLELAGDPVRLRLRRRHQ